MKGYRSLGNLLKQIVGLGCHSREGSIICEALGLIPSISPSKDEKIAKGTQIHSMDLPLSRIVPPCSVEQFPVPILPVDWAAGML